MNPTTDSETPPAAASSTAKHGAETPLPSNWVEALFGLIESRVALFQLESKEAARSAARRAIHTVAVVVCAVCTWALLVVGGIGALSSVTGWPWYWVSFAAAAVHMAAAAILVQAAKASGQPTFPVTRSEFQKDREWIENLKKTRKSSV